MQQFGTHDELSLRQPTCVELAKAAEREFTAFFHAVARQYGSEEGRICAEYWLEEFRSSPVMAGSATSTCRVVTISAMLRVARHLRQENAYAVTATE